MLIHDDFRAVNLDVAVRVGMLHLCHAGLQGFDGGFQARNIGRESLHHVAVGGQVFRNLFQGVISFVDGRAVLRGDTHDLVVKRVVRGLDVGGNGGAVGFQGNGGDNLRQLRGKGLLLSALFIDHVVHVGTGHKVGQNAVYFVLKNNHLHLVACSECHCFFLHFLSKFDF